MVSSIGANAAHEGDDVFDAYLRAKGRAEPPPHEGTDLLGRPWPFSRGEHE